MRRARPSRPLLDATCPVEWSHPLNKGLTGWWAVTQLSGWRGGLTLRDLVRGGKTPNDGTLVNGPSFQGAKGRLGGLGSVSFSTASSQYGVTTSTYGINNANFTLLAWVNLSGVSLTGAFMRIGNAAGTNGLSIGVGGTQIDNAGNHLVGLADNVAHLPSGVNIGTGWHLCGIQIGNSAGGYSFIIDGAIVGTLNTSASIAPTGGVYFGSDGTGASGARFFTGNLDGWMIFYRPPPLMPLTAREHALLYDEQRRGNPSMWRWLSRTAWLLPAASTGLLMRRRRFLAR